MSNHHLLKLMPILAASAVGLSATSALATDGYFADGYGQQSKGLGGASLAYPRETLAIAQNPASAFDLGNRIDVGIDYFKPSRSTQVSGSGFGADGTFSGNGGGPSPIPEFGITRKLNDRLAVGFAVYGNGGMATDYKKNPFSPFGAQGPAGVSLAQIFISPGLAYEIAPGHSIGLAVNIAGQHFKAFGIQPFAGYSVAPTKFSNLGYDTSWGFGAKIGYLGHVTTRLSVGGFYQTKTSMDKFDTYAGLFENSGAFDIPETYGAGLAYRVTDTVDVAADVTRINYSGVASVGNSVALLFVGKPFGSAGGPGFGWKDVTAVKLGINWKVSDTWQLRAGFNHSDNPVPSSQTLLNILAPGVVTDQFSLGATWTAKTNLELSAYVLNAPRHWVNGQGSIPPSFGGGEARVSLEEFVLGVGAGWRY